MAKGKTGWVILALLCCASMLPPSPPSRIKRHRPITETTQGAGAFRLRAKAPKAVPVPNYNRLLTWAWSESAGNYWSNTVFLVKSTARVTDPAESWSTVAVTLTNRWPFTINPQDQTGFFHIVASNVVTHLRSE